MKSRFALSLIGLGFSATSLASGLPFDPSQFASPQLLALDGASRALIRTVGLAADQRPYEPASPLGTQIGLDVGIETTLVHIPDDFVAAIVAAGLTQPPIRVLPVPRIQVHKGVGEKGEIGLSFVGYQGYLLAGGDIKLNVYKPEEGLQWAVRFCVSKAKMGIVETWTYDPQVLASVPLDFAEPYAGLGYPFVKGKVTIPTELITYTNSGSASSLLAFLGVGFKARPLGLRLSLEGAYSRGGTHSLGTKFGFNF